MASEYALPAPPTPAPEPPSERLRHLLLRSRRGRILIAALLVLVLEGLGLPLLALSIVARLVVYLFAAAALYIGGRWLVRRLLWRIWTKLIVSYLFIAVVPVVLLSLFFVIAGVVSLSLVASSLVAVRLDETASRLQGDARRVLAMSQERLALAALFQDRFAETQSEYPSLAWSVMEEGRALVVAGDVPTELPGWLQGDEFAGLVVDSAGEAHVRAIARSGSRALILSIPLTSLSDRLESETSVQVVAQLRASNRVPPVRGRTGYAVNSIALLDRTAWSDGKLASEPLHVRFEPIALLRRLAPPSAREFTDVGLFRALTIVGALFLVVYAIALGVGITLARSITRGIHALSVGTERVRQGDFREPVTLESRDQLGDLAESFNMMASGIEDLLRQRSEKERLEEELRIARQIQMSLLPQADVEVRGLRVAALCLPAAEVGGDYYDLLPLSDTRLAVLVADVSGKGTSAALYMAELKGLVLALARTCESPRELLSQANRILAAQLDSRTFITMSYAVLDTELRTFRHARAGHNPLIHYQGATQRTRVLAPQGIGLGLDPGDRFEEILEEETLPLVPGDVFVLFTDGISEAMNSSSELFGEDRLREIVEAGDALSSEEIKERVIEGVRGFVGDAAPHDDMTMVVVKVTG